MSGLLQRRRRRPEMNLVALIDVLVMLIFFAFVTMQFKSAATLNITLPKVETAGKNEFKGNVTISISKEGELTFNGKTVPVEQIEPLIEEIVRVTRDIPVLIKADKASQLEKLTFVMDACRKNGLNKISIQSQ